MIALILACSCCDYVPEPVKMDIDDQISVYEYIDWYIWDEMKESDRIQFLQYSVDYLYRDILKNYTDSLDQD